MKNLELAKGEVLFLGELELGQAIYGLSGMTWVTQEGDSRDHLLGPGGSLEIRSRGSVVLQALRASRVLVTTAQRLSSVEAVKNGVLAEVA